MSSTWMPRAATSVATRTRGSPAAKSSRARWRWFWLRSPWMAAALIPARPSCLVSRSAPCLVRTKNSVRPSRLAISAATGTLSCALSTSRRCSARLESTGSGTACSAGSVTYEVTSWPTPRSRVAEKSIR